MRAVLAVAAVAIAPTDDLARGAHRARVMVAGGDIDDVVEAGHGNAAADCAGYGAGSGYDRGAPILTRSAADALAVGDVARDDGAGRDERVRADAQPLHDRGAHAHPRRAPDARPAADDGTGVDVHAVVEDAVVLDHGVGVDDDRVADARRGVDHRAGDHDGAGADGDVARDHRARMHGAADLEPVRAQPLVAAEARLAVAERDDGPADAELARA